MTGHEAINQLQAELQQIQDEIDRRHERVDNDDRRQHNLAKIDELRVRKNELVERLAELKAD